MANTKRDPRAFEGVTFRFPVEEREQLDALAIRADRSRGSLVRLAVRRLLAEAEAGLVRLEQP